MKTSKQIFLALTSIFATFVIGIGASMALQYVNTPQTVISVFGVGCGFVLPSLIFKWLCKEDSRAPSTEEHEDQ